jgi:hypothetical protein
MREHEEPMQQWLMLTSADAYGNRVFLRANAVTSITEIGIMEYNDRKQPQGVKGSRLVHTVGGNVLNVQESADAIINALRRVSWAGLAVEQCDDTASAMPDAAPGETRHE